MAATQLFTKTVESTEDGQEIENADPTEKVNFPFKKPEIPNQEATKVKKILFSNFSHSQCSLTYWLVWFLIDFGSVWRRNGENANIYQTWTIC